MPSLEVLRRAKLDGYDGAKSAMYALIAGLRPPAVKPIVRFEGVPGEFSQHDFGQVDVRFVDGKKMRVHFFASRLKYSRAVRVTLVEDEQVESLVRPMVEHFVGFGGVPLLAVFDRPKTIVIKANRDGSVKEWNSTFAQVMLELGVGVELCAPRSGNQKGSVERLVGWVKNSFFKPRRFLDLEDLRRQLEAWEVEVNTKVVSRATGEIPETRLVEERKRLRPVKVTPDRLALRVPISVGPTGMVTYDARSYSMPADAIGLSGTLYLYRDRVQIVAGRFKADHRRLRGAERSSVLADHRASMVAAVNGKRAKRYYKREQVISLGRVGLEYVTELVHRRSETWVRDIDQIFAAIQEHGEDRVRTAMEHALAEGLIGGEYVTHFLDPRRAPEPSATRARGGAQPRGQDGQLTIPAFRAARRGEGGDQ
jgi:transposase